MGPADFILFWQRLALQSLMRPLADLRDLVDVDLSDLVDVDIDIQTGAPPRTGAPAIERKIYSEVARAGKQLGWITEAVLELAEKTGQTDGDHVRQLSALKADIEKVKRKAAKARAKESLDQLKKIHPDSFRKLIEKEMAGLRSEPAEPDPSAAPDTNR